MSASGGPIRSASRLVLEQPNGGGGGPASGDRASSRGSEAPRYSPPTGYIGKISGMDYGGGEPGRGQSGHFTKKLGKVPAITEAKLRPRAIVPGNHVWSEGHKGLDIQWPKAPVPVIVFSGSQKPPKLAYKEHFTMNLKDDRYLNFTLRLKCGGGDHYNGCAACFAYSPNGLEIQAGAPVQLIMITDIVIDEANSSVNINGIGDVPSRVTKVWQPNSLRGLQMAFVEACEAAPSLGELIEVCQGDEELAPFARILAVAPNAVAELLGQGENFTVFAPTASALAAVGLDGDIDPEVADQIVRRHSCPIFVPKRSFYASRTIFARDRHPLLVDIERWPLGNISLNGVPVERLDIPCISGVIHAIGGVL